MSLSKAFQAGLGRAGPLILRFSRYIEKTSLARCARSLVTILDIIYVNASRKTVTLMARCQAVILNMSGFFKGLAFSSKNG